MKVYILNSLVVPINFEKHESIVIAQRKISVEEARAFINAMSQNNVKIISAVGHEATAKLLTQLLNYPVEFNRIAIFAEPNDFIINFYLKVRLPEGKILTQEELDQLVKEKGFWLILTEIRSPTAINR